MKITNNSAKIISIDGHSIFPDETFNFKGTVEDCPAVAHYASLGIVTIKFDKPVRKASAKNTKKKDEVNATEE